MRGSASLFAPARVGVACALAAAALGAVSLAVAGAPARLPLLNLAALVLGLLLLAALDRVRRAGGALALAAGLALLATGLFGETADGVARWIRAGPLLVQPSLLLLPLLVAGFARARDRLSAAGSVIAAVALAVQPDRAMAGMLAAGLAAAMAVRPDRRTTLALAAAAAGFAVTVLRSDPLAPERFVEHVLFTAFAANPLAGVAAWIGCGLLLVPAIVGWVADPEHRDVHAAFGAAWLAAIVAALVGDYPTPVIGYGGSAVVGYVLSLAALSRPVGSPDPHEPRVEPPAIGTIGNTEDLFRTLARG